MTARRNPASLTDVVLGLLLLVAGTLIIGGAWLQAIPSRAALGAFLLVAGGVGVLGALVGRTSAGFFSEITSAALSAVLGIVILRYPDVPLDTLFLVAASLFLVNGIVRVASASEFPALRGTFLIGGAASLALGAAVVTDAVQPSLTLLGILVGIELVVDGVSALLIGRHEHPSRSSR
nr:hypothetical protein [Propionibacterium sp.]